jgi:hypothetical protein
MKIVERISFKAWHKTEKRWATHEELLSEIPVGATIREPSILTVGSDEWELHTIEEDDNENPSS